MPQMVVFDNEGGNAAAKSGEEKLLTGEPLSSIEQMAVIWKREGLFGDTKSSPIAAQVNPRNAVLFNDQGRTIFRQLGSEPTQYASFIIRPCGKPDICALIHGTYGVFPSPGGESVTWGCGCKGLGILIPADFVEDLGELIERAAPAAQVAGLA